MSRVNDAQTWEDKWLEYSIKARTITLGWLYGGQRGRDGHIRMLRLTILADAASICSKEARIARLEKESEERALERVDREWASIPSWAAVS